MFVNFLSFSPLHDACRTSGSGLRRLPSHSGLARQVSARYKSAQIYILFLKSPSYGLRFLRFRTLLRNAEHVGNTSCQHGSAQLSVVRSGSAAGFRQSRYAENRTEDITLPAYSGTRRRPRTRVRTGLSVEKSVPDAEPFETPHISGSYRLRRHFPRYCDVFTCVQHPYRLRILVKRSGVRPDALRHPCATRRSGRLAPSGRSEPLRRREPAQAAPLRGSATSWPS